MSFLGWLVPRHGTTRVGRRFGQSLMHGERAMEQSTTAYVAIDTHKKTISVAIAEGRATRRNALYRRDPS